MIAVTRRRYGPPDVLAIEDVERPSPKDNEVLVRVYATSVTSGDVRIRGFRGAGVFWLPLRLMTGILRPRDPIPGMEFAGEIAAVGAAVTSFRVGEPVFGMTRSGANAEYLTVPENGTIAAKPAHLSYQDAVAIPFGALSALTFLRDIACLRPGERILVHGASGSVGVAAVQLAKHFGAEVTGVCSTSNLGLVRSLGADHVVDYTATDFTEGASVYDIILDTVGGTSCSRSAGVLTQKGRHVFVTFQLPQLLQMLWTLLRRGRRVICGFSSGRKDDFEFIKWLVDARVLKPVIDRTYGLENIVEAHRYVESGHKRGSVVIAVPVPSSKVRGRDFWSGAFCKYRQAEPALSSISVRVA
jgi:NADPH:quinone reductase-like Zn-dependent oxidoreductase